MRIAILGTGALGCLFAGRLAPHARVSMLGTWWAGVEAVRRHGVQILEAGRTESVAVSAFDDPAAAPQADIALILVKSYQTERAAAWAARVLSPEGIAVTLQNGLDNGPRLAAVLGQPRVAVGVTFEGATLLGPGRVRHAGSGPTYVERRETNATRIDAFIALLRRAGFDAHARPEIEGIVWNKAIVNAAVNPLTALWRVPNGELLSHPDRRALLAALAQEAAMVAEARGVALPTSDPVARVEEACRATAKNRSSMLQDIERGRPTEIDGINGAIVAEAQRLGLAVPVNETIWRLVRAMTPSDASGGIG